MLVDYLDSEGSEGSDNEHQATLHTSKPTPKSGKPAFQKVVDRSNPHTIRVNLPEPPKKTDVDDHDQHGPPPKRAKTAGETFSGFNSFLPAPKRSAAGKQTSAGGVLRKTELESGANLKTGAVPSFSREPVIEVITEVEQDDPMLAGTDRNYEDIRNTKDGRTTQEACMAAQPVGNTKGQANAMSFKPLSVSRKPQKKKPIHKEDSLTTASLSTEHIGLREKIAPKVSLFTITQEDKVIGEKMPFRADYGPSIRDTVDNASETLPSTLFQECGDDPESTREISENKIDDTGSAKIEKAPQSLDDIASNLNLTASARRQLLGRQRNNKNNPSSINIVNFSTDQEYAANEILRQAGEQVQHNPVRAIAPGKHSLKQLVSAASNQKDALEEQFATGKRNKKESGSRYGW